MGNRLGYLFMLVWVTRVGILLLLISFSTSSSLARMLKIISSEPKSVRSATLTSTADCRNIRWEKKCYSLQRQFIWLALGSLGLGLWALLGYWSMLGGQPADWISGGNSKMSIIPSMPPIFTSTPLEAHLQIQPS